jgi:hypothetical protein
VRDLLIITPTRRPGSARRLAEAAQATCTAVTDLILAVDDDDTGFDGYSPPPGVIVARGPHGTPGQWTNRIAAAFTGQYRAYASLGDDHLPRTPGWDTLLLDAIDAMGGTGIAYGNDLLQGELLPTAPVITADITTALGWMFLPACQRFFCDNVWLDLGRETGLIRYVPQVTVEHLHYAGGKAPFDAVYEAAAPSWAHDEAAYHQWRSTGLAGDADAIRKLRAPAGRAGAR